MMRDHRRAFVVGAHLPAGGAFMAYCLSRILEKNFGFEPVCISVSDDVSGYQLFNQPEITHSVGVEDALEMSRESDVLIINPSFSPFNMGMRFPGKSICYIQGINTYNTLDVGIKHYISAGEPIRDYISLIYGIETKVIYPFVDDVAFSIESDFCHREHSVFIQRKLSNSTHDTFISQVISSIKDRAPGVAIFDDPPEHRERHKFLSSLSGHRYFMATSPIEGFGLVPLEAMAAGVVVIGFDGVGGKAYMRPEVNCATGPLGDIQLVTERAVRAVSDFAYAKALGEAGRITARQFTQARFERAWTEEFAKILGEDPIA